MIAEMDLCALLGNALDNAMEAAEKSTDKTVRVRCRAEKGLFMLQVDSALAGDEKPDLSTTKKDKTAHGFGLFGMEALSRWWRPMAGLNWWSVCLYKQICIFFEK